MRKFFASIKEADIRNILAVIFVLACFLVQILMLLRPIPQVNHDVVITSIAYTLGGLSICLGYYFGASKSEKKQDDQGTKN